ncbi:MAG: ATP-dependent helicase [Lachnospiraceae bacterium]|nr:ATP-dependent helicase [Lachnospiraceae bacterium]
MHTVGAAQVFAGPGSGKTYVTVQRIKYLITHQGADPSQILVITFTKAAAQEMQERFFRLMEPERPPVRFGTFHAVFYHILKQSTQYRDYSIITESAKRKLIRQIIRMRPQLACLQEEDLEELTALLCVYQSSSVVRPISVQKISEEDLLFLVREYESYLREFRQMDFDGITRYCRSLLSDDPALLAVWQARFRFILIDEFQDISPDQYEIIKLLAAPENNLFIVGDDDQSIYGFRGASPDSMQTFMNDFPDAEKIFLDVNYRCNSRIVDAAGAVIRENVNRVEKQIRAAHENGDGFFLQIFEDESEEETYITQSLKSKQEAGESAQCAMICRTNYECAIWAQILRKNGIAFYMKETPKNPFRHFVIQDIMAYLALAQGELLRKHFLRIINRPVRYLKRESMQGERVSESEMLDYYKNTPLLQQEVQKLFRDLESLKSKRLYLQIHYIRNVIGYDGFLRDKYGIDKAGDLLQIADRFQELSKRYQTYAELNDYISQYDETIQTSQEKKSGQDGSPDQITVGTGIRLITMHASKGLEFDTVYLPGCQEGKIPSAKSQTQEEIEEERRMFYVAMTRAKKELYVTAYKGKSGKDMPSRFLKCLCQSSSSTSSSNSEASRYSSKASATASYSSSSSIYSSSGSSFGSSGFSL